jgi:predicted CoA-substrate-specific enzyme activase
VDELIAILGKDLLLKSALVTGSGRELLAEALGIPAINEISAHATGVHRINPDVRTIIEIGGQDSKFIRIEPPVTGVIPRVPVFRMNEICAAGTGAFLDEQCDRLQIGIESFGSLALRSDNPAPIAGRCAVFAKTDMMHQSQEGTPLPDILLGLAFALARNYVATLVRGEPLVPVVSLQGGVMSNEAVVHAFRHILKIEPQDITTPPHFKVLGALGCAALAAEDNSHQRLSLETIKSSARKALRVPARRSSLAPLKPGLNGQTAALPPFSWAKCDQTLLIMGVDVGSVSVKGVIIDGAGRIVREKYCLSRSRPLESLEQVIATLTGDGLVPSAIAITGSGRYLAGRLLDADIIVNEITAQAMAAMNFDQNVDTVVEIGGQDSKWIAFEDGHVKDFEMNRVCAAGTGSFLMAQADRLSLTMEKDFSDSAFASARPADLGNRCTVFMESDLIHHQNNGAPPEDLAAGVCISIVHNFLERVANHKPLGEKVLFLGGVAATPAVRAAFEQRTGRSFDTPPFFKVSGALGAALKALEMLKSEEMTPKERTRIGLAHKEIRDEEFTCKGCTNRCRVHRYRYRVRSFFHGGLCDRWESEDRSGANTKENDPFTIRTRLLDNFARTDGEAGRSWGMVRSPQFYEWFPFWKGFCEDLGISLVVAPPTHREQFERGLRFLRVETCLPMKVMAGQIEDLSKSGVNVLFHPSILSEPQSSGDSKPSGHCPYIQASSQFFRGTFDVEWKEPVISFEQDPDSFRRDHIRFARKLGFSRKRASAALERGLEDLAKFQADLRLEGERFLDSLDPGEHALVVLGKPYHLSDAFLNMNLGSIFQRLRVKALPGDLYTSSPASFEPGVSWKYQGDMIRIAHEIARNPSLFPVLITFFGCGPDPFTLRHVHEALDGKPLLILEMDEHSARAGLITRIEAFLDSIGRSRGKARKPLERKTSVEHIESEVIRDHGNNGSSVGKQTKRPAFSVEEKASQTHGLPCTGRGRQRPEVLYLPYMCEHSYGFAAAARSVDIDARVLPPPDDASERLGRPQLVGGECHPYALVLGDYLKLSENLSAHDANKSLFYIIGPDACRLSQFPVYIDKVRRHLGLSVGVIWEVDQGLAAFGVSQRNIRQVMLRGWESLNAYDVLLRLFLQIRPVAESEASLEITYAECRDKLFKAISTGRVREGMEEVFHDLHQIPVRDSDPRPVVAVTGDYYTRVVPYANNDVYREIEALGGSLWPPPTFSDCLKMSTLRDLTWSVLSLRPQETFRNGMLYALMAVSEFKVKGSQSIRKAWSTPLDLTGWKMWKSASHHAHTRLPSGITAPIATVLQQVEMGASGILNLMALNCSYGTVVTAALSRALKQRPGLPMLTLSYDGLKKTNEKTRLEAFMTQVHDHFRKTHHVSRKTASRSLS